MILGDEIRDMSCDDVHKKMRDVQCRLADCNKAEANDMVVATVLSDVWDEVAWVMRSHELPGLMEPADD